VNLSPRFSREPARALVPALGASRQTSGRAQPFGVRRGPSQHGHAVCHSQALQPAHHQVNALRLADHHAVERWP
jgi:hypothetical protein